MIESLTHLDLIASQQWYTTQELIETERLVELIVEQDSKSQETNFDYATQAECTKGDLR